MTENIYQGDDFEDKVRKQVEFYFSDSNLQTDRYLWKIYESNDGWVELKTILTFGRMRQYRPEDKVIKALKESTKLKLSDNNELVGRNDPLKEFRELENTRKRNTVHIEGFPKELTQEDVEDFFATKINPYLPKTQNYASIRRIRNRKTKEFFGVVDVEFVTFEDSEYFLNDMKLAYPHGKVDDDDEDVDKRNVLKKMSLLTFQQMKENGKRFGMNEVNKRRGSFNAKNDVKKAKPQSHKLETVESNDSAESSSEPSSSTKESPSVQ